MNYWNDKSNIAFYSNMKNSPTCFSNTDSSILVTPVSAICRWLHFISVLRCNISTTCEAWKQMLQDVHVITSELPWKKQRSTRRRLLSPTSWTLTEEEPSKLLYFGHRFVWCWNLDTSESISEIPWEVWSFVLRWTEKIGWIDCIRNEEVLPRVKLETISCIQLNEGQLDWLNLGKNRLLQHVIKRRIKVNGRRGRRLLSYWITLREREDTENWKRKHYITLNGELALEVATVLS